MSHVHIETALLIIFYFEQIYTRQFFINFFLNIIFDYLDKLSEEMKKRRERGSGCMGSNNDSARSLRLRLSDLIFRHLDLVNRNLFLLAQ